MAEGKEMKLHVIAEDYEKHKGFIGCGYCLLEVAAKRQMQAKRAEENINWISIDGVNYRHDYFGIAEYNQRMQSRTPFTIILKEVV